MYNQFNRVKINRVKNVASIAAAVVFSGFMSVGIASAQQTGTGSGTPAAPGAGGDPLAQVCTTTTTSSATVSSTPTAAATRPAPNGTNSGPGGQQQGGPGGQRGPGGQQQGGPGGQQQGGPGGQQQGGPGGQQQGGPGGQQQGGPGTQQSGTSTSGQQGHPVGPSAATFNTAATTIGVSCSDLVSALKGGQSIAQVATSHNVTTQSVIDAIVAAETTAINQKVTDGTLTQTQADQIIADLTTRITDLVNRVPGQGGPGGPGGSTNQPPATAAPTVTSN